MGRRIDGSKIDGRFGRKKDDSDSGDSFEMNNGAEFQKNVESDLDIDVT